MPNITSYQGSWILWFAERERTARQARGLRPPVPLHKVDPKYIPAAIDERIQGKVRLSAIIRVDGRVDQVELLRGVDPRLDLSATEALLKWEFAPAERDGKALAVEVVVEIPFQLAPRAARR
jgi:TonB family protein